MHRVILNPKKGIFVDHINHDKLDNRRYNLRLCTKAENCRNSRPQSGFTSEYKGVSWDKRKKKWLAKIVVNYKPIHVGYFSNEVNAAKAYNKKAVELHGEFAWINTIEESVI